MRLGATFITLCMAIVAGAAGWLLHALAGASLWEALAVTFGLFAVMLATRPALPQADREAREHIAVLSHNAGEISRHLSALDVRLANFETRLEAAAARPRGLVEPLVQEMGELSALVKQLAETVARQEAVAAGIAAPRGLRDTGAMDPDVIQTDDPMEEHSAAAAGVPPARRAGDVATDEDKRIRAEIAAAIAEDRIELFLQPIVSLPQRKVRFYEAVSRLRMPDGEIVAAADFLRHAERAGLVTALDNLAVRRCIQILFRLWEKNRDIGLFCNISAKTLAEPRGFAELRDQLAEHPRAAASLILELRMEIWQSLDSAARANLEALTALGYRVSLDHVETLGFSPRELAERQVKFVKTAGHLLLSRPEGAEDIHPADYPSLLARFGIELVADRLETEAAVLELLDHDLRYGQGFLFAPPRPVRAEMLGHIPLAGAAQPPAPVEPQAAAATPARRPRAGLAQLATSVVDRA